MNYLGYIRLMRLDKPVGIFLLWSPTAWALWTANHGNPPMGLLFLFFIGTILMRSAGCVINDIADIKFDKYVSRTQNRPLTSGELSLKQAIFLLIMLLTPASLILLFLPLKCFYLAIISLLIVILYPLCKRWINMPQIVLGLAFSMSIPMVIIASGALFNLQAIIIFVINFLWIISYDTIYAMSDKPDDLLIGIKSTAIYFGSYDRIIIAIMQIIFHLTWLLWTISNPINLLFYVCWILGAAILFYQQYLIHQSRTELYIKAFKINVYYGIIMWLGIILGLKDLKFFA